MLLSKCPKLEVVQATSATRETKVQLATRTSVPAVAVVEVV